MEQQIQQTTGKKSKWWLWLIILIIILIVLGVVLYFVLTGDGSGFSFGGSSIPKPPALPE